VVCAYNEERTIEQCLASLERCNYPDLEVVVCDDGSSDRTLELARRFPFEVLALPHGGLSAARNAGIAAATGDIVAFLDADAACIPEWPWRLALSFDDANVAASGGPNLPFREAGLVERAVSYSPGSAREVLVTDDRAEHVPGCNMAFRRDALLGVGCFDPVYTSAGDDVDVCWKLLDEGREIAFSAAAEVHHHRRATVGGYFRQQRGYGRAEKLLWSRHRHRFNRLGQASWNGFIYGPVRLLPSLLRPVIYHGHQGRAPFQPVMVRRSESVLAWAGALLPLLAPVSAVGGALALFSPVWWLVPAVAIAIVSAYGTAVAMATPVERGEPEPLKLRVLVGALHVAQPFVRTWGRLQQRTRRAGEPRPAPWSGDRASWLHDLERLLRWRGATVRSGSAMDGWDLEVGTGPFVRMRITTAVAWRWVPQYAMRLRVTLAAWLLAAGAVTVGLLGRSGGRPIAGVLLASIGAESSFLRKRVRRVLEMTTSGARHDRTGARQVGKSGEP
jgi:O-antigen biosynthesis protein